MLQALIDETDSTRRKREELQKAGGDSRAAALRFVQVCFPHAVRTLSACPCALHIGTTGSGDVSSLPAHG
ncbi:hypothetical protein EON66_08320 [archaeon]|nr:MAG: hypothetical protein EON66_08320 [archaeon]